MGVSMVGQLLGNSLLQEKQSKSTALAPSLQGDMSANWQGGGDFENLLALALAMGENGAQDSAQLSGNSKAQTLARLKAMNMESQILNGLSGFAPSDPRSSALIGETNLEAGLGSGFMGGAFGGQNPEVMSALEKAFANAANNNAFGSTQPAAYEIRGDEKGADFSRRMPQGLIKAPGRGRKVAVDLPGSVHDESNKPVFAADQSVKRASDGPKVQPDKDGYGFMAASAKAATARADDAKFYAARFQTRPSASQAPVSAQISAQEPGVVISQASGAPDLRMPSGKIRENKYDEILAAFNFAEPDGRDRNAVNQRMMEPQDATAKAAADGFQTEKPAIAPEKEYLETASAESGFTSKYKVSGRLYSEEEILAAQRRQAAEFKKGDKFTRDDLDDLVDDVSTALGLEPSLIKAVIKTESNFNHTAVSKVGAKGLMQLMPATAGDLGVKDPFNPVENVWGGARYLKKMIDRNKGNVNNALASYNWGPGNFERKGLNRMPKETRNYIASVNRHYASFKKEDLA